MNAPVMVELEGETDPLEVRYSIIKLKPLKVLFVFSIQLNVFLFVHDS